MHQHTSGATTWPWMVLLGAGLQGTACDTSKVGGPVPTVVASGLRTAPPSTPGGHTIAGQVRVFEAGTAGASGLCVALMDPEPRAFGASATELSRTTTDASGQFSFSDLPVPPTVGWVVVVDACGDASTWMPTGTPLPGEQVGGRGAGDQVDVVAWLVPTAVRDQIDAELTASGSRSTIGEDGGMVGHNLSEAGAALHDSWVRGPNATQLWYDHGGGDWALYDKTDAAQGALWVAPDAEDVYGVWVTRVAEGQFAPLMAGGLPGVLLVWDFVSWTPRTSAAL